MHVHECVYVHKYVHVSAGARGSSRLQLPWGLNLGPFACSGSSLPTEPSLLPKATVTAILLRLLLLPAGFHFVAQVSFELTFASLSLLSTRFREVHLVHLEAVIHM